MARLLTFAVLMSLIFQVRAAEDPFTEIGFYLSKQIDWKVTSKADAEKLLFNGIGQLGAKGISANWSWYIRDAIVCPADIPSIAKKGDVIWFGQFNDSTSHMFKSQPIAIIFINARTGEVTARGSLTP